MGKRYFEFVEGTSNKFWEIWSEGNEVFTRYGKIGSDGQTTVKDQGSAEGAKKLYDKLVREKTGKGYEEKGGGDSDDADDDDDDDNDAEEKPAKGGKKGGSDHESRWAAIAELDGAKLVAAMEKEWAFMLETPKCKPALARLLKNMKSAAVTDGKLVVTFDDQYDGETTVTCSPPTTEKVDAYPKSWQKFMTYYDGVEMDSNLDVPTFFNGTSGSGAFEQSYVEEVEPELYEKAQDKEIEFDVPIDLGQDWVVANPFKKNKLGEPMLYFFSHEGGGFDDPYPAELGLPAIWLRLMTQHITDEDFFDKKQSDDPDDDADDDESGDGDESGSGARRFEFSEGSSNKFWEIRVEGSSHTVRFGKIGTDGQTKTKDFDSAAAAKADADKLVAEKTKKGYEEV